MIKAWLIGLGTYIIGVMTLALKVKIEERDNPEFIQNFYDAYINSEREDSMAIGAPYLCAIFPGLNFLVGIGLIVIATNEKIWNSLIREILDKK